MSTVGEKIDANGKVDISGMNVRIVPDAPPPKSLKEKGAKFQKMGKLTGKHSMNVFSIMTNLTKPEQRVIAEISNGIKWPEYIAHIPLVKMTKAEKSNWYRTFKKLKKRGLVQKLGADGYMINPSLVIPSPVESEKAARQLWENLK